MKGHEIPLVASDAQDHDGSQVLDPVDLGDLRELPAGRGVILAVSLFVIYSKTMSQNRRRL